jgi:hypothetical protein
MVKLVRHPPTKGRVTDRLHLNHRATSRLYPSPPLRNGTACAKKSETRRYFLTTGNLNRWILLALVAIARVAAVSVKVHLGLFAGASCESRKGGQYRQRIGVVLRTSR